MEAEVDAGRVANRGGAGRGVRVTPCSRVRGDDGGGGEGEKGQPER